MKTFDFHPPGSGALIVCIILCIVLVGVAALMLSFGVAGSRLVAEVSAEGLRIRGDLYGRLIRLPELDLQHAAVVQLAEHPEYRPVLRTNGTGLPGYASGWFRLRNRQKALLFLTPADRVAFLPTRRNYVILLSVRRPEELIASLREQAGR